MVKRLISANSSEMLQMKRDDLKQAIKASEGRVILSENVVSTKQWMGSLLQKLLPASGLT